ncbi:hypothetical protein B0H13DRAFT_1873734 [Mycena leptocephala]|nr:hypothetical protein B0H13DRAFT_1873734 [Mycena leptocephala]
MNASIHAVLEFSLPRSTLGVQPLDNAAFFSKYAPDPVDASTILRLRHLDLPPVKVIRQLFHDANQAWLDGFTSIKYEHLSGEAITHFPLWVISFWMAVIDIRLQVRKPWTSARDWLKKQMEHKKNPEIRKQAAIVAKLLGILPWNAFKRGLSDASPIHTLYRFLGPEWLSSTDENDMLEMLRDRVASDPELAGSVRVEAVEFTAKLVGAYKTRHDIDYHGATGSRWLHSLGTDVFVHGERLITIAHLGEVDKNKHWAAIEVDGPQRLFRYGDSFGKEVPAILYQAYEWWKSQHIDDAIHFDTLPSSTQMDGHSWHDGRKCCRESYFSDCPFAGAGWCCLRTTEDV